MTLHTAVSNIWHLSFFFFFLLCFLSVHISKHLLFHNGNIKFSSLLRFEFISTKSLFMFVLFCSEHVNLFELKRLCYNFSSNNSILLFLFRFVIVWYWFLFFVASKKEMPFRTVSIFLHQFYAFVWFSKIFSFHGIE